MGAATVLLLAMTSCSAPKNIKYFENSADVLTIVQNNPIRVRPDDKLVIVVKSKDAAVSDLFNLGIYTTRMGATGSNTSANSATFNYQPNSTDGLATYTVTPEGYIDFPILGKLKVEGMTRAELAGFIKGELMGRDLVKDPTVTVEFVNTGINVIGEVKEPGRYEINRDHINVVEAIALAGDAEITGERTNVKVIRQEGDQLKTYTLDLTDLDKLAKSPAFSLQQNDIVYVQPNVMKQRQSTVNGNNALSTSFWISVASLITTAVTTVGVFVNK